MAVSNLERVFARIAGAPPRVGERVRLPDGRVGVVDTAKRAEDGRDTKCTVLIDRRASPNRYCYLCAACGTIAPADAFPALIRDMDTERWRPAVAGDSDPLIVCPACGEQHTDDDSGPGLYDGARQDVERQRAELLAEYHDQHGADWAEGWDETWSARTDGVMAAALAELSQGDERGPWW